LKSNYSKAITHLGITLVVGEPKI